MEEENNNIKKKNSGNKIKKNVINVIVFLLILIFLLELVSRIFIPHRSNTTAGEQIYRMEEFYRLPKETVDVLCVGDSNVHNGISSMKLYTEKGITACDFSASSAKTYYMYYYLKEALTRQKPKLVVLDTCSLYDSKDLEPRRREAFDYLRFGKTKLELINDSKFANTLFEKISYIFPILRYHDRWNKDFSKYDFTQLNYEYYSYRKGCLFRTRVVPRTKNEDYMNPNNNIVEMDEKSKEYLDKIIDLCNENNIEFLLLSIPNSKDWKYEYTVATNKYAEEKNIKYLDLNSIDIGLDWNVDTVDGGMHQNFYGMEKVTAYIAEYLEKNYNLDDHRGDSKYSSWENDVDNYLEFKKEAYEKLANNDTNTEINNDVYAELEREEEEK